MSATLIERDGDAVEPVDRSAIEKHLRSGEFFWLDLQEPDDSDFEVLREACLLYTSPSPRDRS